MRLRWLLILALIATATSMGCQKQKINNIDWRLELTNKNLSTNSKVAVLTHAVAYYFDTANHQETEGIKAMSDIEKLLESPTVDKVWKDWWMIARIRYADYYSSTQFQKVNVLLDNYIREAERSNSKITVFNLLQEGANYYITNQNDEEAQRLINRMQSMAEVVSDQSIKILFLLSDLSGIKRQPIDQLNYLLDARNKSIIAYNDSLLLLSYERLSDFYFFQNKFSIAKNFLEDAQQVITNQKVVDSYAYYHIQINTAIVENKAGNWDEALVKAMSVSNYAERNHYGSMENMAEAEIRGAYINKGAVNELAKYYTTLHPNELKSISEQDKVLYFRIMAYIYESKNNKDSAIFYFQKAETNMRDMSAAYQSNFYSRLADFYKRQNDSSKIGENYRKAFECASASHRLYMTVSAGDSFIRYGTKPSILFLDSLNSLKDQLLLEQNNDAIRDMELSNVLKQKELEEAQQHEEKSRKSNIQLQILALIIALVFMSMVIISNFKVPKWWFKIMSYISLITFFELILYIIVYRLDFITNKEPMKVLSIKVAIIAILTPLHHYIEHFVVNFLSNHKVLSEVGDNIKYFVKKNILRKIKDTNEKVAEH